MKVCKDCGKNRYNSEYYKSKNVCKECYRDKELAKYHQKMLKPGEADKRRYAMLEKTYGISKIDWNTMYVEQDGRCNICNDSITTKQAHTDHNHATGAVRGLLCHSCNTGIGLLKDSPKVLTEALRYLNERGHYGQ